MGWFWRESKLERTQLCDISFLCGKCHQIEGIGFQGKRGTELPCHCLSLHSNPGLKSMGIDGTPFRIGVVDEKADSDSVGFKG